MDPLNQTMPIGTALANNLKVNNIVNSTIGTEGGNGPAGPPGHHREMSLDDERGNRRTNMGTAAGQQKAEIIASRIVNQSKSPDRYVIGNNLVVNLGGSPGTGVDNNSTSSQGGQVKPKTGAGSIFPSTTTATTANSLTEQNH